MEALYSRARIVFDAGNKRLNRTDREREEVLCVLECDGIICSFCMEEFLLASGNVNRQ